MEASAAFSFSSSKTRLFSNPCNSIPSTLSCSKPFYYFSQHFRPKALTFLPPLKSLLLLPPLSAVAEALESAAEPSIQPNGTFVKIDKSGRFCSPRAAREFALLIVYAACLEGSNPICLFNKRLDEKKEPGYVFDKTSLLQFNHMSYGGESVQVESEEEAKKLIQKIEKDFVIEAEVLSAPPKLVYNKFVLRLTRNLLKAVVNRWDENVLVIDKIAPQNWKDKPAARILEICILHLAMAEMVAVGTPYKVVINEAVDLTKRFCDGSAPRVINGCLGAFIKDHSNHALI